MSDSQILGPLNEALRRRGLPDFYIKRALREISGHLDELRDEGLAQGMAVDEASAFAKLQFGDQELLAAELADRRQQSSWMGRHSFAGFVLLPVATYSTGFLAFLFLAAMVGDWLGFWQRDSMRSGGNRAMIQYGLRWIQLGSLALASWYYYWLARRSGCGLRVCAGTSLALIGHGLLHQLTVTMPAGTRNGSIVWGYSIHFDPVIIFLPLLILAAFIAFEKHRLSRASGELSERAPG